MAKDLKGILQINISPTHSNGDVKHHKPMSVSRAPSINPATKINVEKHIFSKKARSKDLIQQKNPTHGGFSTPLLTQNCDNMSSQSSLSGI